MKQRASPNFNQRPSPLIDTLVLHYTGMPTAQSAIDLLCDPAAEVSSHYVVEEDGTIWQLVPEAARAWHAGVSYWRGRRNLNDVSIGIEVVNPGFEWGYRDFPAPQMAAVTQLCQAILARHPIPPHNVVAHSDIAPNRKQDPGERFDWRTLARNGVGLWPDLTTIANTDSDLPSDLSLIGYDMNFDLPTILRAFQRHWHPEAVTGEADPGTIARITALAALTG